MYRRVIGWLLAVFVIVQGAAFIFPGLTRATDGRLMVEKSGDAVGAIKDSKLTVLAPMKFVENGGVGGIGNNLLCTSNVTFNLSPDPGNANRWLFDDISYGDAVVFSGSCAKEGADFVIKNHNSEVMGRFNTATPPRRAKYSLLVEKRPEENNEQRAYLQRFNAATGKYEGYSLNSDFDPDFLPISGLNAWAVAYAGLGNVSSIPVKTNVDIDDAANSALIMAWFEGKGTINDVPVNIYQEASRPPEIVIPAGGKGTNIEGSKNPELVFKLIQVSGTFTSYEYAAGVIGGVTGAILTAGTVGTVAGGALGLWLGTKLGSDQAWTIFQATNASTDKVIKGLIILGDNKGPNWEMIYVDSSFDPSDPTTNGVKPLTLNMQDASDSRDGKDGELNEKTWHNLFRYLFDDPGAGEDNCKDGRSLVTGPNSTPKTIPITRNYHQLSALSSNCLNKNGSGGWPDHWGVTVTSETTKAAECGLGNLFEGNVGEVFSKALDCLFDEVFKPIVSAAQGWVNLAAGEDAGKNIKDPTGFVFSAWQATRSLINLILIIALLAISFSNILRINIDTYAVKKALPNLVIGVILANASFLIIRYMLDIATVATNLFAVDLVDAKSFGGLVSNASGQMVKVAIQNIGTWGSGILAPILVFLAALVTFVLLAWLAFLLYFRLVAIYLLTILAPLAFVAYGIPGMDKYFKQWWQQAAKWVFIVPAMAAVFWIMSLVNLGRNQSIAQVLIMWLLFTTALTIPSKWGGSIIDKASNAFKKGGKVAGLGAKAGYGWSQRGGANLGARGRDMQQRADLLRAAGKKSEAEKLERGAKWRTKLGGKITAPTAYTQGLKAKREEEERQRGVFIKTTGRYNKTAGEAATYQAAKKISSESNQGLSYQELQERLKDKKLAKAAFGEKGIQALTPELRDKVLSTNQNEQSAAIRMLRESGDLSKEVGFFEYVDAANTLQGAVREQRRHVGGTAVNSTNDFLDKTTVIIDKESGKVTSSEFPPQDSRRGGGGGAAYADLSTIQGGLGTGPIASHLNDIARQHAEGASEAQIKNRLAATLNVAEEEIAEDVAKVFEHLEVETNLKNSRVKVHFDNFSNNNLTSEALRNIRDEGAKIHDKIGELLDDAAVDGDLDAAVNNDQVKGLLESAGMPAGLNVVKGDSSTERAEDLRRITKEISQAAGAVVRGTPIDQPLRVEVRSERAGRQLDHSVQGMSTEQQLEHVQSDPGAATIINNYAAHTAQASGAALTPQQITAIGQTVKNMVIEGIVEKRTMKRMFGSKVFQDKVSDLISNQEPAPNNTVIVNQAAPEAAAAPAPQPASPDNSTVQPPAPPPAPDVPEAAPVDSPDDTVI